MEQPKGASNQTRIFSSPIINEETPHAPSISGKSSSSSSGFGSSEMGFGGDSDAMTVDPGFSNIFYSSSSSKNPFSIDPRLNNNATSLDLQIERPSTIFKPPKPSLKYRDQNSGKSFRSQISKLDSRLQPKYIYNIIVIENSCRSNITSHWNQRKPIAQNNAPANIFMRHKTMGGMVIFYSVKIHLN